MEDIIREQKLIFEEITEEGLYRKSTGRKIEQIGFYLRFIGEHFIPCAKCQRRLLRIFKTGNLHLSRDKNEVHLIRDNFYEFGLPFIKEGVWLYTFKPCKECQKVLKKTIDEVQNLTIGNNSYAYPVELWKKYEIDDDSWKEVEKRKPTVEEEERFKDKIGETTYL